MKRLVIIVIVVLMLSSNIAYAANNYDTILKSISGESIQELQDDRYISTPRLYEYNTKKYLSYQINKKNCGRYLYTIFTDIDGNPVYDEEIVEHLYKAYFLHEVLTDEDLTKPISYYEKNNEMLAEYKVLETYSEMVGMIGAAYLNQESMIKALVSYIAEESLENLSYEELLKLYYMLSFSNIKKIVEETEKYVLESKSSRCIDCCIAEEKLNKFIFAESFGTGLLSLTGDEIYNKAEDTNALTAFILTFKSFIGSTDIEKLELDNDDINRFKELVSLIKAYNNSDKKEENEENIITKTKDLIDNIEVLESVKHFETIRFENWEKLMYPSIKLLKKTYKMNRSEYCILARRYEDYDSKYWANSSIGYVTREGIFNGYEDGEFKPNNKISRIEYIIITLRALDYDIESAKGEIWYKDYLEKAISLGLIKSGEYDEVSIVEPITRKEMAKIIVNGLNLDSVEIESSIRKSILDYKQIDNYYRNDVVRAYSLGLINGKLDGSFDPDGLAKRSEAAVIIRRAKNEYYRGI
ncbi:S-layer homology domain-containing protein [Dethiosulfatibacter aminovorans DSM 17477]|uniref:S-layer homology domain-containing protein n=1 Tax=Dethiosulfatibacter aminovorans DSM 17477 TaxID=1121476 RepID=A0A1M6JQB0_9FIRM|nr:S-layer homology domain-containing protein [Dethiosulfatibacter aminovorans]SHJ48909.1 S-layer homology domain-containing protein [Dethiosulfatibacter aminovorans DSM 17477]